jgi:hypothetical protein
MVFATLAIAALSERCGRAPRHGRGAAAVLLLDVPIGVPTGVKFVN